MHLPERLAANAPALSWEFPAPLVFITDTFDAATISGGADNCVVTILIASRNNAVSIDSADAAMSQLAIRTCGNGFHFWSQP